jgi:two-component system LytT family response regulator
MNVIIVDDEEKSRSTTRSFITRYCPELNILDEADGVETGLKSIKLHQPDLVFMDVEMKDGTGFDLLSMLKPIGFRVIFITAFDQYAITAFNFSASDYLLKPLDPTRLVEAVNRLKMDHDKGILQKKLEILIENINAFEKLALPEVDGLVMVRIKDIVRLEAESNYTKFYMKNGQTHLATKTLKEYDEIMPGINFYRIHKSHFINLDFVSRYIKGEGGTVVMEDGTQLEVARRRKEGLINALRNK